MEMDHLRCAGPSQEHHVGRLLAPGEGSVTEAHTVTANALVAKRADILSEIGELEMRIDQLRTELVHLDAALRMFSARLHRRSASGAAPSPDEIAVLRTRGAYEAYL
jgi:hypothetical protein